MTELEKFEHMYLNKLNGNLSDYAREVKKLTKPALVRFIAYCNDQCVNQSGDVSMEAVNEVLSDITFALLMKI